MLYAEKDEPAIKTWIVKHLESPSRRDSDVDADVLADYVLALLRHEGSPDEVRKLCEEELYDFLKDETVPFVRDVFASLGHTAQAQAPATAPALPPPNGSRKRAYHESSLPADAENGASPDNAQQTTGHAAKLARRMPYPEAGDSEAMFSPEAALQMQQHMARMFALPPGGGGGGGAAANGRRSRRPCRHFEKKGYCSRPDCRFAHGPPTATGDANPAAYGGFGYGFPGLPMPPMPMLPSADDADAGAAAAGFPYHPMMLPSHGMFSPAAFFAPQAQQMVSPLPRKSGGRTRAPISADGPVHDQSQTKLVVEGIPDEYLDEAAVRTFFEAFGTVKSVTLQPARRLAVVEFATWAAANAAYQSPKVVFDNRFVKVYWHKEAGDGAAAAKGKTNKAKGRSKGSSKTGTADGDDAAEQEGSEDGEDDADADDAPAFDMDAFLQKQQAAQALHEEKRRKWEEVERQRQALEARQRALLAKQQDERQRLIAKMASVAARAKKQQEQQQQQQQRQGGDAGEGGDGTETPDGSASSRTGAGDEAAAAAAAQTAMIRAQLAALEEEAKLLGLDPDAIGNGAAQQTPPPPAPPHSVPWTAPFRGRGGHYRGGYGGRGGARGGRGGSLSSRYAAYSLDNRPRRVAVRGVDFAVPAQNEALRQYLLGVGEYEAIDTVGSAAAEEGEEGTTATTTTVITFADRRTAEKFFYGLRQAAAPPPSSDGESSSVAAAVAWKSIPGVDGPVAVEWATGSGSAAAPGGQSKASSSGGSGGGGGGGSSNGGTGVEAAGTPFVLDVESDDEGERGRKDGAAVPHEAAGAQQQQQQPQAQNVDFDVADEDWDMQ